jgi:uncharacterized ferritin-like protein (DUF455 family)
VSFVRFEKAFVDSNSDPNGFHEAAGNALRTEVIEAKLRLVSALAERSRCGDTIPNPDFEPNAPLAPGRPPRPILVAPRELERRSTATREGHAALIHAITHIEFNAINLALDAICRFPSLPYEFYMDWLKVAAEEARHFSLLDSHLRSFGFAYGDFCAHDGLWEMAVKTAHDPLARMALVPRVLEARGLDATPAIIRRLKERGDQDGVCILEIILRDEVGHVAIGTRWFHYLCDARSLDPDTTFEALLAEYNAPRAVLPLNLAARQAAHFSLRELQHIERVARARYAVKPR